jgi:hypothetical protein
MEHRGFQFSVVQGLGHNLWRWYLTVNGVWLSGEAETERVAVAEAQKAIDHAISTGAGIGGNAP